MLNLDTGATASSGGDLLWSGTALVPQTGANVFSLGAVGKPTYDSLTQATLAVFPFANTPITAVTNGVIACKTRSGNYAKILITTVVTGGSVSLQFTTFGASGPGSGPSITSIQNNYGQVPPGLPNYGIAPSTLFFIQGTGLANATSDLQSSASPGLQTTLSGVSVKVTVGTTTVQCPLYYLSPTQIDAVLPGNTPTGTGTVTVTNGTATATGSIAVVQSAFGILFYNGTLAAAYDANNALLTTSNAANPNQTIVLWGSGVGFDPNDDDKLFPQKQDDLTSIPMHAFIGGVEATIAYRGRSQYPGVDQVVVTIPGNVSVGCNVAVAIVSGNIVSNSVTIPIAATGRTCSDSNTFPTDVLAGLNGKTSVKEGVLSVSQTTTISNGTSTATNSVGGTFFNTNSFAVSGGTVSVGSCLVSNSLQTVAVITAPLDAGAAITVTGPGGSLSLSQTSTLPGLYFPPSTVPAGFIPAAGGAFTFDNGSGGKDIQHFNATLNMPPILTWTNQAQVAAVTRSQGVNITWSGGGPGSYVVIDGNSSITIGVKVVSVTFTCLAPVSAGQFTVPVPVLLALPAGTGSLIVGNTGNFQFFTATGLDLGLLNGSSFTGKSLAFN
jgi:uncharacterized protein (TIGR03437 family)